MCGASPACGAGFFFLDGADFLSLGFLGMEANYTPANALSTELAAAPAGPKRKTPQLIAAGFFFFHCPLTTVH
jgi:hypothetical protein